MSLLPTGISDPLIEQAFRETEKQVRKVRKFNYWSEGKRLEDIDLTTEEKPVAHGLGRKPKGMLVLKKNAAKHVFESTDATKDLLYLSSDGTVTVTVWVF
tara:strand:+ start:996 stop:1295 length:300 start_codon:yes stop_codon:yes gene_type:complete